MRFARTILLLAFSFASAANAFAVSKLVRFDIAGMLDQVSGIHPAPTWTPAVGSPFSGSFVFDVGAIDQNATGGFANYHTPHPLGVISLKVGDREWNETGESPVSIVVGDNIEKSGGGGIVDSYFVGDSRVAPTDPLMDSFFEYWLFRWDLEGPASLFSNTSLPDEAFSLEPWMSNRWSVSGWGSPPAPLVELSGVVTSFTSSNAAPPIADFNIDGQIDGADLSLWRTGYGTTSAVHGQGDADFDRDVDGADFLIWQRQLHTNLIVAAVPEPSSASMLVLSFAVTAATGIKQTSSVRRRAISRVSLVHG
jgi:hypothetical protein